MRERSREQRLIDIMFMIAQRSYLMNRGEKKTRAYYEEMRDRHMRWVAEQLRACGFDTQPMGASFGVLKKKD